MVIFVLTLFWTLSFFEADQDLPGPCDPVWDRMLPETANEALPAARVGNHY
jgi:hypothetical protein